MNGKEINWSVDGNKTSEYSYQGGKKNGSFKTWYNNGRKKSAGSFINDSKDGKIIESVSYTHLKLPTICSV